MISDNRENDENYCSSRNLSLSLSVFLAVDHSCVCACSSSGDRRTDRCNEDALATCCRFVICSLYFFCHYSYTHISLHVFVIIPLVARVSFGFCFSLCTYAGVYIYFCFSSCSPRNDGFRDSTKNEMQRVAGVSLRGDSPSILHCQVSPAYFAFHARGARVLMNKYQRFPAGHARPSSEKLPGSVFVSVRHNRSIKKKKSLSPPRRYRDAST